MTRAATKICGLSQGHMNVRLLSGSRMDQAPFLLSAISHLPDSTDPAILVPHPLFKTPVTSGHIKVEFSSHWTLFPMTAHLLIKSCPNHFNKFPSLSLYSSSIRLCLFMEIETECYHSFPLTCEALWTIFCIDGLGFHAFGEKVFDKTRKS